MKNRIPLICIKILIILIVCGCKKNNTAPSMGTPGANEVWIQNSTFTPASITVAVNTTIKWTNKDGITHTVTSNNALFDSGNIGNGGTYSRQFTTAGTYPYHCSIHSSMAGTVVVQ